MAARGRPTKLSKNRERIIVAAVRGGNTRQCAANLAGISHETLNEWLSKGRAGDPKYSHFADQMRLADGHIEKKMVAKVTGAKDWKAARAWLGTRRVKTWGEQAAKVELKVEGQLDMSNLTPEELDQLLQLTSKTKKDAT